MVARSKQRGIQAPLPGFEPHSDWRAPSLSDLPNWDGARRVSYDIETRDEDLPTLGPGVRRAGNFICGFSFALEDGPQFYVPLRHGGGGNVDVNQALAYLRHQAATFKGDVCGAGLQYDLDWSASEGVEFKSCRFFRDVQVAAPLVDELQYSYSLEAIAGRAGVPGKDEAILQEALSAYGYRPPHVKRGLHALPARLVGPYGEQDARLPLTLLGALERDIEEQNLWGVYDLESRVLPLLVAMRRRGVRVSLDRVDRVESWSRERQAEAVSEVARQTGLIIGTNDITSPTVKVRILRAIGVEPERTRSTTRHPNGQDSVTKDLLESIEHPVGKLLRRALKMTQLRSTFCDAVRKHAVVNPYTGEARIHCTFNQLRTTKDEEDDSETKGAAYGRLSCENPNLQQQPSPDRDPEIGTMWRAIYLPDEGTKWVTRDYSQQEPRMAVHYAVLAGRAGLITGRAYDSAMRAMERYKTDKKSDFHDMMTRLVHGEDILDRVGKVQFKLLRRFCKEIFLGLSYGMGGAKLCRKLGLSTKIVEGKGGYMVEVAGDEGQAIIDKFNNEVPFVRATAWAVQQQAKKNGYIITMSGRRCRFPKDEHGNIDWSHKAFNRLIQGSSADQTKEALVALFAAGFFVQLQVHDELDRSEAANDNSEEATRIMETCVNMTVPSYVDIDIGDSWGEAA